MVTIDREKIGQIERLFTQGTEEAAIALAARCSARTVRRVLSGKHPSQLRGRPDRECGVRSRRVRPTRCRGCGGLVHELPCRLCLTLSWDAVGEKNT